MNRRFGVEIENIVRDGSANHIVLKSRSFSFENKSKLNPNRNQISRRVSYNQEKPPLIHDQDQLQHQKLLPNYLFPCVTHMIQMEKEKKQIYMKSFLSKQTAKTEKEKKLLLKRSEIIDWMVSTHYELKLFPQTLFCSISYLDQYLFSKDNWDNEKMELLGLCCLFIGAKFEQTYRIPSIRQLKKFANFSQTEIIEGQSKIIQQIGFQLISDSSYRYLQILAGLSDLSKKNTYIAQYILQLSLLDSKFLLFQPSLIGSAVIYLVHKIRKLSPSWPKQMAKLTGYEQADLRPCAKQLCSLLQQSQSIEHSRSIRKKFSLGQFCEASKIRLQRKAE